MSEPQPTPEQQQFVEAIYRTAAEQMRAGTASATIEKNLMERGLDAESARAVVSNLATAMAKAKKQAGRRNMLIGALWCVGGTAITAVTYQAAISSPGGGHYLVAWGAILFGGIQFLRGLGQSIAARL